MFPTVTPPPPKKRETGQYRVTSRSAKPMSLLLKCHTGKGGEHSQISMHSFPSEGGVSRALAGDATSTIIQRMVVGKPANGLEVHASSGGSLPGHGWRCQGRGCFREPAQ